MADAHEPYEAKLSLLNHLWQHMEVGRGRSEGKGERGRRRRRERRLTCPCPSPASLLSLPAVLPAAAHHARRSLGPSAELEFFLAGSRQWRIRPLQLFGIQVDSVESAEC
jgi:hypothetical protein